MSSVSHLSMRVPWRDQPWDGRVCADPRGNSSCTLLSNIGPKRDDTYEIANAGRPFADLDSAVLPCLSERAAFFSSTGYTVTKTHPYARNPALSNVLVPTDVTVPGYAFEAVPFRWLSRETYQPGGPDAASLASFVGYSHELETNVDTALGYDGSGWLMDSRNQRAAIASFFESVEPDDSLIFIYMKHSPLQEARTDRLLVGAAHVRAVTQPPLWNHKGRAPFESLMWETIVEHSLRPPMTDGILLPYQQLIPLLDDGTDVDAALAWAPPGRGVEFSYVTEHVSDDAAIAALESLLSAAIAMEELGVNVPAAATTWARAQIDRLWNVRGPAPSLKAALTVLGAVDPARAGRAIHAACVGSNPWNLLRPWLDGKASSVAGATALGSLPRKLWAKLTTEKQDVLQLLSTFDISTRSLINLLAGQTQVAVTAAELLENPYNASICTYGQLDPVSFATVDRALFPPPQVDWTPAVPATMTLTDPHNESRIEALLTDVVVRQSHHGDTVMPQAAALDEAAALVLNQPPPLTELTLEALELDAEALGTQTSRWSPLSGSRLADDTWAFKLAELQDTADVIRAWVKEQRARPRLGGIANARDVINGALARDARADDQARDVSEEAARTEKAEGLSMLHDSPLSVLLGGAGTGKTTLLRALVEHPDIADTGVLLLAPTGKATVQLQTKVRHEAHTLGSYLLSMGRYDPEQGTYLVTESTKKRRYGLVVVDEASMLTEHMLAALLDSFEHVDRLVLVGDPNQLPPIGAGRPYFDLVHELRPEAFPTAVHVAESFVELLVPRRQLPDGATGRRLDLDLASWFSGDRSGAGDDHVWHEIAITPDTPSLRYVTWGDRTAVEALNDVLADELELASATDPLVAFATSYGAVQNGQWTNWEPGAGAMAEAWQVLSPTRSREFGTVEVNRDIKDRYRAADTELATKTSRGPNIASPVGPERIVRGDKVIHTRNGKQPLYRTNGSSYVANGEIGVGLGRTVPAFKLPKRNLTLQVEFSSQLGTIFEYWPSSSDDPRLELAWAVTVHKAQGSEFGTTFLLLPKRANVSRELMYTALTRQRDRVVIVHDGDLSDLRDLGQSWRSENAQRLTDLFAPASPVELTLAGRRRRFDQNRIHIAANGTPMASKNEVIIASLLDQLVPGSWEYEKDFPGADGRTVSPDFSIRAPDGRLVLWEHAGMLDVPNYAAKWELKKQWYADQGVLPFESGGGPNGTLMWTDDRGGVDAPRWRTYAAEVLDVTEPGGSAVDVNDEPPARRPAAKKLPGRRPI